MSYEGFIKDEMIIDAVLRNLGVIGEAAKNIPDKIKRKHQNVPWKRMVGLRNILIHEYSGLDLSIIWEIASRNLPEVKPMFEEILQKIE